MQSVFQGDGLHFHAIDLQRTCRGVQWHHRQRVGRRHAGQLTDPVAKYIPAFANLRVLEGGPAIKPVTRPATQPMRIVLP